MYLLIPQKFRQAHQKVLKVGGAIALEPAKGFGGGGLNEEICTYI